MSERNTYEGMLIGETLKEIQDSNPLASDKGYSHIIWDNN